MKFTETHEWIVVQGQTGTVGITDFAQKELGDIVYVELPEIGKKVKAGEESAVLESTKAAADVYAPVSGTIIEVNSALVNSSQLINQDAEKEGWIFKLKLANFEELDTLLDRAEYESTLR